MKESNQLQPREVFDARETAVESNAKHQMEYRVARHYLVGAASVVADGYFY
jgi:hypothetical protein